MSKTVIIDGDPNVYVGTGSGGGSSNVDYITVTITNATNLEIGLLAELEDGWGYRTVARKESVPVKVIANNGIGHGLVAYIVRTDGGGVSSWIALANPEGPFEWLDVFYKGGEDPTEMVVLTFNDELEEGEEIDIYMGVA